MDQYRYKLEECMLAQMQDTPYAQISVTDLCLRVGCSRKAFYRYFQNKANCLDSILERTFREFDDFCIPAEPEEKAYLPDLLRYLCYWKEQRPLLDVLIRDGLSGRLLERSIIHVVSCRHESLRWLRANGLEHAESILLFSFSGIMAIILKWHIGGYKESPEEIADILTELLTKPLITDPRVDTD